MGLAVLPARLKGEMELLEEYILEGKDISSNLKEKPRKVSHLIKNILFSSSSLKKNGRFHLPPISQRILLFQFL